jgi:hypothetical protein
MPQITFDVSDAQLLQIDQLNAARNQRLKAGEDPHSRQTVAAAGFAAALEADLAEEKKAAAKTAKKTDAKG